MFRLTEIVSTFRPRSARAWSDCKNPWTGSDGDRNQAWYARITRSNGSSAENSGGTTGGGNPSTHSGITLKNRCTFRHGEG